MNVKHCVKCGTTKSYITKRGYLQWYSKGHLLCNKCHAKEYKITNPEIIKRLNAKFNPRKLVFGEERIQLDHNPRKGICSNCKRRVSKGEIKTTNIHHEKYDPKKVLAHTVELCVRCHNRRHAELRRNKK